MEIDLGEVSAQGEARRRSQKWANTQDSRADEAGAFLRRAIPKGQQISVERERTGTVWTVKRGDAPANLTTGSDFRRTFGPRSTSFRVTAYSEEYRLALAAPSEVWRMGRGRAFWMLYLFLVLAALGAVLMIRPLVLFEAISRFE